MPDPEKRPRLSIIVPAYNESRRLPDSLRVLSEHCQRYDFDYEVLAMVETSTDDTVAIAREAIAHDPHFEVVDNKVHRGKGYAIRSGVLRARGELIFSMDADLSVPPEYIDKFIDYFDAHPEVEVLAADRHHPESVIERKQILSRQMLGRIFNAFLRLLSATRMKDTQCGFKAMRRRAARAIYSRQKLDGFACDVEVLMLAEKMGFQTEGRPVIWINSPHSKVRIVKHGWMMVRDVIAVRRLVSRTLREMPWDGSGG